MTKIKDLKSVEKMLDRTCIICGADLAIEVDKDRTYSGGHYFPFDLGGVEYWECEGCFNDKE